MPTDKRQVRGVSCRHAAGDRRHQCLRHGRGTSPTCALVIPSRHPGSLELPAGGRPRRARPNAGALPAALRRRRPRGAFRLLRTPASAMATSLHPQGLAVDQAQGPLARRGGGDQRRDPARDSRCTASTRTSATPTPKVRIAVAWLEEARLLAPRNHTRVFPGSLLVASEEARSILRKKLGADADIGLSADSRCVDQAGTTRGLSSTNDARHRQIRAPCRTCCASSTAGGCCRTTSRSA